MNEILLSEVRQFIRDQPDDREVHLYEGKPEDKTGCVLAQFMKSKGMEFVYCGFGMVQVKSGRSKVIINDLTDNSGSIINLFRSEFADTPPPCKLNVLTTYGALKAQLV